MRIIVIEDEVKIREGLSGLIESQTEHMIVGEAADGEEGLEMIMRFKPDLIITDIQMPKKNGLELIKAVREKNISAHIVILSGYSEFEYAQKAIRYGVDEYLLKPLGADDVKEMIQKIEEKIRQDEMLQGTVKMHFRNLLSGNEELVEQSRKILGKTCDILEESRLELFAVYMGDACVGYRNIVEEGIGDLKERHSELEIFYFYNENSQRAYILTAGEEEKIRLFERNVYNRFLANYCGKESSPVWTKIMYEGLENTKKMAEKLERYIAFSMVDNPKSWITEEMISSYEMSPFVSPDDIYHKIRNAVCRGEKGLLQNAEKDFLQYMRNGKYGEEDVRGAFIKGYYLIMDTLRDIDKTQYTHLKSANIMRNLERAVTRHELENAWCDISQSLFGNAIQREDISNYVIKKAINYIREHYKEGITLEEISGELDITPEYLSTLFTREVGIKFSVFLKQFRISHAKRLLQGTEKKIYEIAQEVGYSDVKYFQRVFKEEIGVSPGDYRQMKRQGA